MPRARLLATLVVAALCAAGATPAHAASELFVQSADRATTTPAGAKDRYTVTLRGTPRTVLAFDDRPQRRSRLVPVTTFLRLWGRTGAFRADPPNAALVGTANGRRSQTVVELVGATRVRGGVRYAVRTQTGRPPRRLAGVSLFVDPAPSAEPNQQGDVVVRAGQQLTLAFSGAEQKVFSSLMVEPGGSALIPAGCVVFIKVPVDAIQAMLAATTPALAIGERTSDGQYILTPPLAAQVRIAPTATLSIAPFTVDGTCAS